MWTSPFSSKIKIRNSYSNLPEQIVTTTETHFIPEHSISFSFKRFVGTEGKRLSHYQLLAWNFLARTRYNFPIVNFLQFYNWTYAWRFVSLFEVMFLCSINSTLFRKISFKFTIIPSMFWKINLFFVLFSSTLTY